MNRRRAASVLGVAVDAPLSEVRAAYRATIRVHHPDRAGVGSSDRAATIIEAYRTLIAEPTGPSGPDDPPPDPVRADASDRDPVVVEGTVLGTAPPVHRLDADTILLDAPAEETFRWLLDAAHDVGEITYVDRSMPILEVLCRFVDEPATSLLLTLQGRGVGTEVFCTTESIEARPAPPTAAVVDLLELALHRRHHPPPTGP